MSKAFFILILAQLCFSEAIPAAELNSFRRHISEAIHQNEHRRDLYENLARSIGLSSISVSNDFILSEKLTLKTTAVYFDIWSSVYERSGINALSAVFEPMSRSPQIQDALVPPPSSETFIDLSIRKLSKRLSRKAEALDWKGLEIESETGLALLKNRSYNCMSRHVLESLRRISRLAPRNEVRAQSANLPSLANFYQQLATAHILSLSSTHLLDRKAAPLQAKGLQIICNDVPHIP